MAFEAMLASQAGGLIPVEYSDQIFDVMYDNSAALALGRIIPMTSSQEVIAVPSTLPTAAFTAEGSAIATSQPALSGLSIVTSKLGTIIPIGRETFEDSNFDLQSYLIPQIGKAFADGIDKAIFWGSGKPTAWTCNHITSGATAASMTASSTTDIITDLNTLMGKVEAKGYDVNGFVLQNSLKSTIRNVRAANGSPIYNPQSPVSMATLYGERLMFSKSAMATGCRAIVGDFNQLVIGLRRDITMRVLTEASLTAADTTVISLAQNDMVGIHVTMRLGFQIANPATGVSTPYPFAVYTTS